MKKSFCFYFLLSILAVCSGYLLLIFGTPLVMNSQIAVKKYENIITEKTGFPAEIKGFNFSIKPDLSFVVSAESVLSRNSNGVEVIRLGKLKYLSRRFSTLPQKILLTKAYVDFSKIDGFMKNKGKDVSHKFSDLSYFPQITAGELIIKPDDDSVVKFTGVQSAQKDGIVFCRFLAEVRTPHTKTPVYLGEDGFLYFSDKLYLEDLSVRFEHSKLNITGEIENLDIFGGALPVKEIERAFVFFANES